MKRIDRSALHLRALDGLPRPLRARSFFRANEPARSFRFFEACSLALRALFARASLARRVLPLLLCALSMAPFSWAEVRRTGEWPEGEKVSLAVTGVTRDEAVRRLAAGAGWSLVAQDLGDGTVSLDVREQSAARVLELLLAGETFVVEREGSLVSVRRETPAPATSAGSGETKIGKKGEDLFVTEDGRVPKGVVVRDVFVWGGTVVIEGTVTGSVAVFGGQARLSGDAYVREDVIAFGGTLEIENGARVDGDVAAVFGKLHRGDKVDVHCTTCGYEEKNFWKTFFDDLFGHLTAVSILWLLGAITVAVGASRVEVLREELERRPLRSFGLGIAAIFGLLLLLATLVVTLIGIPLAILSAVLAVLATYLGFCVLLLAIGRRLVGARSTNPYVHLAIGCGLHFLLLLVPGFGGFLGLLGAIMALGGLVATRGAGLLARKAP